MPGAHKSFHAGAGESRASELYDWGRKEVRNYGTMIIGVKNLNIWRIQRKWHLCPVSNYICIIEWLVKTLLMNASTFANEKNEEGSQMSFKIRICPMKAMFLLTMMIFLGVFGATGSARAEGSTDITLEQAKAIISAAQEKAKKQGTLMDIAVVDAGANLKAFVRMDGAFLGSIDISIKKAKTARFFNMPTGKLGELAQPGKPLYNIEFSNGGLITFPGGLPLIDKNGNIIGAIGVSGSSVEDDNEVALAGAEVLLK
jgi:uncharacterized protein GlcG (DUF336 family)